jgi:flagellar basal body rod protein FlgG
LLIAVAMNVSLAQAAAALHANERWQEIIAENLASSSIPGYRKQDLSFAAVQAGVIAPPSASPLNPRATFVLPKVIAATSFQPGELTHTGVNTNLALEGEGFFEVQLPNGDSAYTRSGEFRLNAQGQLVTHEGYLALGESGPIQLDLNNPAPMSVSASGQVSQGSDVKGRIRAVNFNNPQWLQPIGGGYFLASNPNLQTEDAPNTTVRQGFLEAANTSPVKEMANLIFAMRTFEANQRIVQLSDDRVARAISELGNPS